MWNVRLSLLCTTLCALVSAGTPQFATAKPPAPAVTQPAAQVVSLTVDSIDAVEGQLVANAVAVLDVAGQQVTQDIQIPLQLGGSPGTTNGTDILNLSLGPVNLDLLGLVVELDDCDLGPVTVDITAAQGGGVLGDLLSGVAGLLNGGLDLGSVLNGLTQQELDSLTTALETVLNAVLADLPNVASTSTAKATPQECDILMLEVPNGIHLDLLGLAVDTSPICLDVYAQPGAGNLLGNLLCDLTDLLNQGPGPGNSKTAHINNLVRAITGVLDQSGL